jgi:hypothetical protein
MCSPCLGGSVTGALQWRPGGGRMLEPRTRKRPKRSLWAPLRARGKSLGPSADHRTKNASKVGKFSATMERIRSRTASPLLTAMAAPSSRTSDVLPIRTLRRQGETVCGSVPRLECEFGRFSTNAAGVPPRGVRSSPGPGLRLSVGLLTICRSGINLKVCRSRHAWCVRSKRAKPASSAEAPGPEVE